MTSRDCINIEKQLGYTYSQGSLDNWTDPMERAVYLKVSNIDKMKYPGSFLVRAYYKDHKKKKFIGQYPVLTRWNKGNCKNCQFHLMVTALFDLTYVPDHIKMKKSTKDYVIEVVSKDPLSAQRRTEELKIKENPSETDPQVMYVNI